MGRLENAITETAHRLQKDYGEQNNRGLRLVENIFEGTETKNVIVLVVRIQNHFATISSRSAQQGVEQANRIFDVVAEQVTKNHGTLYNIKGDSMYCVWPLKDKKASIAHCLMTAIEIRKRLVPLNEERAKSDLRPLYLRMGAHASHGYVGLVGPSQLRVRRVLGPAEHVAEILTKECEKLGLDVLLSNDVAEMAEHYFKTDAVSSLTLPFIQTPLNAHKLTGYLDNKLQVVEIQTPYSDN